ncbi:hypothetical protein BC941DRAFT_407903 [Chlamydoabsidia padenii]|nr:hypothetical protein BC941DRAFT_407903 [Chlamydoabsidia padenii]
MQFSTLDKELDAICKDYDYGIVPGSVTVFVRDTIENMGRLELTLLEGIMVIIDVSEHGYMVNSCIPVLDTPTIPSSLKLVQDYLEYKFETMDKLLLTLSPLFAQRFLEKIQASIDPALPTLLDQLPLIPPFSSSALPPLQQEQPLSPGTVNDIFEWIH